LALSVSSLIVGGVAAQSDAAPAAQGAVRTVWDGVYTDAQAERGKEVYLKECASCHADNLQGGDVAPGLVGGGFLAPWIGLPVADLYERTRISMPQDRPGQLGRAAYADILAYLFKANEFPSGTTELDRDLAALRQIQIESKPQK
jgi:quinoprotein glucose dehydrogenase